MPRDVAGATRSGDANLRAQDQRTGAGLDQSETRTTCLTNWGPTFDMSGDQNAQHFGRPLDGGVRFLLEQRTVFATHVTIVRGGNERRLGGRVAVRSRSVAGVGACADARGGARCA